MCVCVNKIVLYTELIFNLISLVELFFKIFVKFLFTKLIVVIYITYNFRSLSFKINLFVKVYF